MLSCLGHFLFVILYVKATLHGAMHENNKPHRNDRITLNSSDVSRLYKGDEQ
jgi:hypothetical protein